MNRRSHAKTHDKRRSLDVVRGRLCRCDCHRRRQGECDLRLHAWWGKVLSGCKRGSDVDVVVVRERKKSRLCRCSWTPVYASMSLGSASKAALSLRGATGLNEGRRPVLPSSDLWRAASGGGGDANVAHCASLLLAAGKRWAVGVDLQVQYSNREA